MHFKPIVRYIATFLLLALPYQVLHASGWGFNNTDILYLLKEGRSDSSIIARIGAEQTAIFKLEPDDLMTLKNAGANLGVISAMLARVRKTSGNSFALDVFPTFKSLKAETLPLITRQGRKEIDFSRGEFIREGYPSHPQYLHLEYPGLHSSARTTDQRPSLLIRFKSNPATYYYLAKLDTVEKLNIRAFKVKVETHAFRNVLAPAKRWKIEYTATEEEKGVWRITPTADLEPGEYGLLDGVRLFEFGVDAQEKTGSPAGSR